MRRLLVALISTGVLLHAGPAAAGLIVGVTGVSGAGITTWTLSGSSTASQPGTIRTSAGTTFDGGDTFEASASGDFINNAGIQDAIRAITGAASITIGGITETITHIFLDDDGSSWDDFGIRTANILNYASGAATSWAGSFTVNIDIDDFNVGSFPGAGSGGTGGFTGPWFAAESDVVLNVSRGSVPEPGSLALLGLGLAGLAATRRRRQ